MLTLCQQARDSDSDSGSSVGMPDDTYIVRKAEGSEEAKSKKTKVYTDFDPEEWQNEEVKGLLQVVTLLQSYRR